MNFSSNYVYKHDKKSKRSNDLSLASNAIPQQQQQLEQQQQQPQQLNNKRQLFSLLEFSSAIPPPPLPSRPMCSGQLYKTARIESDDDDDEPDTNVVTIKFDKLMEPSAMQAGDAIKCNNCDAYLSHISKLEEIKIAGVDDKQTWKCEFCNFVNNLQIDNEEIPKLNDVTYMLEPAPGVVTAATAADIHSEYVVYCIDISGSMSVTTEVRGNFKLPTDNLRDQRAQEMAAGEPFYRQQQRYVRHVSRLEAVQVAIYENLAKLEKDNPNKRVGLITFNHEVISYGDGFTQPVIISGDFLNKKESIEEKAQIIDEFKPVKETKEILNSKLLSLEEGGATALGPALLYSILVASKKPGSKVILCTDGLANKGVGQLDGNEDQTTFYNELATLATSKGVSVSIITIEGTTCKLGILGEVAEKTGGIVNIVNPLNIKDEFSSILEDQIIATNVVAKFLLHKAMYVKDYENLNNRQSVITRNVGNATQETEITFEFSIRDDADIDENVLKEIPFQLQIIYTAKDGSKALRILTQMKPLTSDRKLAEAEADRTVLAQHFVQSNIGLMKQQQIAPGKYQKRQAKWDSYIRNVNDNESDRFSLNAYSAMNQEMSDLMAPVQQAQQARDHVELCSNQSSVFHNVSDEQARKGFKLANLKSKFLKKK